MNSGGAPRCSGSFRVMQRLELKQWTKIDGGGAQAHWSVARKKRKKIRQKGESEKRTRGPIYKAVNRWHAQELRRLKNDYVTAQMP